MTPSAFQVGVDREPIAVLAALGPMAGYALLFGIVAVAVDVVVACGSTCCTSGTIFSVDRRPTDEFQRRLGDGLRRVREDQRLTLRAVEVLSHGGFKPVTLAAYERGSRALTVETAAQLAWLYGVPLGDLLDQSD